MFLLKSVSGFYSCAKGQNREKNDHHDGNKNILIIKRQISNVFGQSLNTILVFLFRNQSNIFRFRLTGRLDFETGEVNRKRSLIVPYIK